MRDEYGPGDTIDHYFHTFSAGVLTTLGGSPVLSVYKQNNTTEDTAGVTLAVDFDGRTGLNHVRIDTSGAFYVPGADYAIVITTGTIGSTSVAGSVVATFSLSDAKHAQSAVVVGTVDTTGFTPTTTEFECDDITEATADHYVGRIAMFLTGALADQQADITAYTLTGGRGHFTVTAMTEAAGNNVKVAIL
jgi:hypothetical protein